MADPSHIPDLLLERYALGELDAEEKSALERRLALSPESQARLAAIRRENEAILLAYPPEKVVPLIQGRARTAAIAERQGKKRSWPLMIPVGSALAMAALAVVLLRPLPTTSPGNSGNELEATRVKGLRPLVLVFPKPAPGKQAQPLSDGEQVKAHELLQIAYVAAGKPHGVVLSIDGRGEVTLHHPAAQNQSSRLLPGQVLLPSAYELDDAPLFERFFFVTSGAPIEVAAVLTAARRLAADPAQAKTAALALPAGLEQSSLLLNKVGNRAGAAP